MTAPTYPRIDREIAEHGAHIMGYLDAIPMETRLAVWASVTGQMWQPVVSAPYETPVLTVWPGNAKRNPSYLVNTKNNGQSLGKRDNWWFSPPAEMPTLWLPLPKIIKEQSDEADT